MPSDVLYRIARHLSHLQHREGIRIDRDAIARRVVRYRKKRSETSQKVAKVLEGILASLVKNWKGDWHRPLVSPFHTKTGRDTALGSALNYVPKDYWASILVPPKGGAYVLLDFMQQEPIIAAHLAGCDTLLEWYRSGDIYEQLAHLLGDPRLDRPQIKTLLIAQLYGISETKLAEQLGVTIPVVRGWVKEVKRVTNPIGPYLDRVGRTIRKNNVATSLDWRYAIDTKCSFNSLRNWSIQATGADIMRRACRSFDAARIPLLLTNHDSFLIQVNASNFEEELEKAKEILEVASAEVLDGFRLKAKVEMVLPRGINSEK
ncbi:DNA polymerase [Vibrio sp. 10N.286.54.B2]|uniref:DNA polymerase n=1 Tax=Vibrio sp. 10N.286.54.B2 TaxID=3229718 RepID=UPI003551E600